MCEVTLEEIVLFMVAPAATLGVGKVIMKSPGRIKKVVVYFERI